MRSRLAGLVCAGLLLCVPATSLGAATAPTQLTSDQIMAVSCPSTTLCAAVAVAPQAQRSTVIVFDPASPQSATTTPLKSIRGERCPGQPICYVPSDQANVLDIDCPSATQCTTVDLAGVASTFNPASPASARTDRVLNNGGLTQVSCPTTSQCTAIEFSNQGTAGRQVTFDPGAPVLQQGVAIDPNGRMYSLDCPTTSECVAGDTDGFGVTFDPHGAASAPYKLSGSQLTSMNCPSTTQCTALDNPPPVAPGNQITFDPARPPSTPSPVVVFRPQSAYGLACTSTRLCVASAGIGIVLAFDPTARVTPDARELYPGAIAHATRELSCPTTDQCTSVSYDGLEITYDPTPIVATPAKLTVKRTAAVVAVVVLPNAKVGAKVAATLTKGRKKVKAKRLTVGTDHTFSWKVGKLGKGSYVAKFTLGKQTVKTIRIKVK
jgi:hypothetical protein